MRKSKVCNFDLQAGYISQPKAYANIKLLLVGPNNKTEEVLMATVLTNGKGKAKLAVQIPKGPANRQILAKLKDYTELSTFNAQIFAKEPKCLGFGLKLQLLVTQAERCVQDSDCSKRVNFLGCSMDFPVNQSANVSYIEQLINQGAMNGCGVVGIPYCPTVIGTRCGGGVCRWVIDPYGQVVW